MSNNNHTPNGNLAIKFYLIALIVIIIDHSTKYYFNSTFKLYETADVIPPILNWTLAYNHGAAFSFLANAGGWQKYLFAILGLAVSAFIMIHLRRIPKSAKLLSLGVALILGGAIGNVVDRFIHGYVIDFIHVHYHNLWHYPVFNVADIGICLGVAMVVWDMLFLEKKRKSQQ